MPFGNFILEAAFSYVDLPSIITLKLMARKFLSFFFVTHISIVDSDIFTFFFKKAFLIYRTFCYYFLFKIHSFGKLFEFHLFLMQKKFKLFYYFSELLRFRYEDSCFQAYLLNVFSFLLSLTLNNFFRTLTDELGCFPFNL